MHPRDTIRHCRIRRSSSPPPSPPVVRASDAHAQETRPRGGHPRGSARPPTPPAAGPGSDHRRPRSGSRPIIANLAFFFGRRGFVALLAVIAVVAFCLHHAFVRHRFNNHVTPVAATCSRPRLAVPPSLLRERNPWRPIFLGAHAQIMSTDSTMYSRGDPVSGSIRKKPQRITADANRCRGPFRPPRRRPTVDEEGKEENDEAARGAAWSRHRGSPGTGRTTGRWFAHLAPIVGCERGTNCDFLASRLLPAIRLVCIISLHYHSYYTSNMATRT